ncbi:MAG: Zn-ribbon domain-containing OB-fold protein [Thermoproteus sp.]
MTGLLFKALAEGRLVGSYCPRCNSHYFPPTPMCPRCRGEAQIVDVPKRGVVLTYSEVYVSNGLYEPPYYVAVVQFGPFRVPGPAASKVGIGDLVEWRIVEMKRPPGRWYRFYYIEDK